MKNLILMLGLLLLLAATSDAEARHRGRRYHHHHAKRVVVRQHPHLYAPRVVRHVRHHHAYPVYGLYHRPYGGVRVAGRGFAISIGW